MLPYAAKLQKVEALLEIFHAMGEGQIFCDLGGTDSNIRISYFPPDKAKLGAFLYLKERFGKVEKEAGGNMYAEKDEVSIRLFGVCECRVVRFEDVVVPAQEATEERIERKPIYECLSPLAAAALPAAEPVTAETPAEEVPF